MRIYIVGSTGSGKTTLARRLAERRHLPRLDIDSVWRELGGHTHRLQGNHRYVETVITPRLRRKVLRFARRPGWVIDGNYAAARPLLMERADRIVFLKVPLRRRLRNNLLRELRGETRPAYTRRQAIPFFRMMIKRGNKVDRELAEQLRPFTKKTLIATDPSKAERATHHWKT